MGSGVAKLSAQVMSGADDLLIVDDHSANGDFINLRRKLGLLEGLLHEMAVWEDFEIHAAYYCLDGWLAVVVLEGLPIRCKVSLRISAWL